MLKVLTSHKSRIKRTSLGKAVHSKTLTWIDCNKPDKKELKKISKVFGISESDLKDATDPNEIPRVEENSDYKLIILRSPFKIKDKIKTTPLGIFITQSNILTIHKRQLKPILDIHNNREILDHGVQYFALRLINNIITNYFSLISRIDKRIEKLEEKVFSKGTKNIGKRIFELKKTLTFFQRSLISNRKTISQLIKENVLQLSKKQLINFEDLLNDTNQLIDMINTHKEILTGALEIHATTISNQLNQVMKKMTVIGSLVLLPTLIASIYGMNFGQVMSENAGIFNMPELAWIYGYPFALGLMALSCILLYIYFKRKRWL